ncbi:hypothetical protein Scep_022710 [Stephania cephalantha]|uniref:Zinc finger PHD-type domain-containing protein n=1 Tax=Stephania cephalantha TaxID=152367 RepID=A0AAP0F6Y1_9MAGN
MEFTVTERSNLMTRSPAGTNNQGLILSNPGTNVHEDIEFLYQTVLQVLGEWEMIKAVLDNKRFVKEWPFRIADTKQMRFICGIEPEFGAKMGLTRPMMAPNKIVEVPPHATVGDLKCAAEDAFRSTYCFMEKFKELKIVKGLIENEDDEKELVFGRVESGEVILVTGSGLEENGKFKYEGGEIVETIECFCGENYEGERFVRCEGCRVWQHTRCAGIKEDLAVPSQFQCAMCKAGGS